MMNPVKKKKKFSINVFGVISLVLLGLYTVSILAPMLWIFISSFKSRFDFLDNKLGWPKIFEFKNYLAAFNNLSTVVKAGGTSYEVFLPEMFLYTLLYASGATVMHTLVPAVTAYAVAKYKFKLGKVIYGIVIVTMLLPIVGNLPAEMRVVRTLGLYDNIFTVWILKANFLGFNFLMLYSVFKGISWEYAEAAEVDGASRLRIMLQIMFPMAMTGIFAVGLLSFVAYWNDYYTPMIYLPSYPTVSYGLYLFQMGSGAEQSKITVQFAAFMIVAAPMFIIYMIFRNKLLGNIAMGGIKA